MKTDSTVVAGELYKHFKGARYRILVIATDSETDAPMVVYENVETGRAFVRSVKAFLSPKVHDDGREEVRFTLEG